MVRRLFLVELDPSALATELKHRTSDLNEFLITETFIPQNNGQELIQLLSSSRFRERESEPDQRWAKAEFRILSSGWKLEKIAPREEISMEEYYKLLLSEPNDSVEQKVRTVFTMGDRRYALEVNGDKNYAVVQIDSSNSDDSSLPHHEFFECFPSITVVGELFMSLEETFCRLYLKRSQSLENTRVF